MNAKAGMAGVGLVVALAAGCGGDAAERVMANPAMQSRVMTLIASHSATANPMMDQLVASDTARAVVVEKVLGHGETAQSLMLAIARDPSMMDGVINLAVQDSAMRTHVMTLFKGMQIAGMGK